MFSYRKFIARFFRLDSVALLLLSNLSCAPGPGFVSDFSSLQEPVIENNQNTPNVIGGSSDEGTKSSRPSVFFNNVGSGLCMDVPNSSLSNVGLIQWGCHDDANQLFELWPSKQTNIYSIVSRVSNKCLDIKEMSLLDGAPVIQYPCSGSSNQLFLVQSTTLGLQLIAQHSKKCIGAIDSSAGSALVQKGCTLSSTDQKLYWSNSKETTTDPGTGADSGTTTNGGTVAETTAQSNSWKNFFTVCWQDAAQTHIKYARQMGYDYIGINNLATPATYGWIKERAGLKFYLVDPLRNRANVFKGFNSLIDLKKTNYTQSEKDFYNKNLVWKSQAPFPNNLATGWFEVPFLKFQAMLDFQQQAVIDNVVEGILQTARSYENKEIDFTFAGVIFDVPRLWGDFHESESEAKPNAFRTIKYWTGTDSGLLHPGITHQYLTYQDGVAAFFKKLNVRMKQEFPSAKWIVEPMKIYNTDWGPGLHADGWVEEVALRADKDLLKADFISQEGNGTHFVDDERIFNSGMVIPKDIVGSTQQLYTRRHAANRLIAAKAAINGSWYNWFGRMGNLAIKDAAGKLIDSIENVNLGLKLIRALPNWDNLNKIPLDKRFWNATSSIYQSPKSFASSSVIYSRHWKTGQIFSVFLDHNGIVKLNAGETIKSIQRVDGFFIATSDGMADVIISNGALGKEVKPKSTLVFEQDVMSLEPRGIGYIITTEKL